MNTDINDINDASMGLAAVGMGATVVSAGIAATGVGIAFAPATEIVATVSDELSGILGLVAAIMELVEAEKSGNETDIVMASVGIGMNALQILLPFVPKITKYGEKYAAKFANYSNPDEMARFYNNLLNDERKIGLTTLRKEWNLLKDDYHMISKALRRAAKQREIYWTLLKELKAKIWDQSPEIRAFVKNIIKSPEGRRLLSRAVSASQDVDSDAYKIFSRYRLTQFRIAARVVRTAEDIAHITNIAVRRHHH